MLFSRVLKGLCAAAFVVAAFACAVSCAFSGASAAAAQTTGQNATVIHLTVLNLVVTTTYSVSVVKAGTGSGTVTSGDGVIVCGSICFESNIANASSTVLSAVADSGSMFTGWNIGGSSLTCPGTGTCTVATTSTVTATFILNPTPPPNPTPSGPATSPIASLSGPSQFLFEAFSSMAGTSSAVINWYTTIASLSNISWGVNSDGATGSGSETVYNNVHSVELDNLAPDTAYILTIAAKAQNGAVIYTTYNFRTLPIVNSVPLNASGLTAQTSFGGNILLGWNNPFEPDFSSVIVTRGTRFYPRDPDEGYIVYQGNGSAVLDANVVPGQQYYYSVFVVNFEGAHSSGALLKYGLPFVSGAPATSSPVFGGTVSGGGTGSAGRTASTTASTTALFSSIIFMQNNTLIPEINSTVSVATNVPTLVEISANAVPKGTQETTITIGRDSGEETNPSRSQQIFIFTTRVDGSLQATIPAILSAGSTTFSIDFLQFGSEVHVNGIFVASGGSVSSVTHTYFTNYFLSVALPIVAMILEWLVVLFFLFLLKLFFKR